MPCRDYGREDDDRREAQERLDKVTRMLCGLLGSMEAVGDIQGFGIYIEPELMDWWMEHKRQDAERQKMAAREAARQRERVMLRITELESELARLRNLQST